MTDLTIGHLPFVGAGEFDTSWAPVDTYDDGIRIRCFVNYGSFDVNGQYREGGILWLVEDEGEHDEIHLVGQEGDARLTLFAENAGRQEYAEVEYDLSEVAHSHVAKGVLFQRLGKALADAPEGERWSRLLCVAFRNIDMDATLRGMGYSEG